MMVVLILVLADTGVTILWFTVQVAEKRILTKLNNMLYNISGFVTVSCYTKVEAESEEEARDIANQRPPQIGTGWCDPYNEVWIVDDIDGEPIITDIDTN